MENKDKEFLEFKQKIILNNSTYGATINKNNSIKLQLMSLYGKINNNGDDMILKHLFLHKMIFDHGFSIFKIENDSEYYFKSDIFEGYIFYDIKNDIMIIFNNSDEVLIELKDENLNGYTVSQYLIEYTGK